MSTLEERLTDVITRLDTACDQSIGTPAAHAYNTASCLIKEAIDERGTFDPFWIEAKATYAALTPAEREAAARRVDLLGMYDQEDHT